MFFKPKVLVALTAEQENLFWLIKHNTIWLEKPYSIKGDNHIKITSGNPDTVEKPLHSSRVFSQAFDEMLDAGYITCTKIKDDFYIMENLVNYENPKQK